MIKIKTYIYTYRILRGRQTHYHILTLWRHWPGSIWISQWLGIWKQQANTIQCWIIAKTDPSRSSHWIYLSVAVFHNISLIWLSHLSGASYFLYTGPWTCKGHKTDGVIKETRKEYYLSLIWSSFFLVTVAKFRSYWQWMEPLGMKIS